MVKGTAIRVLDTLTPEAQQAALERCWALLKLLGIGVPPPASKFSTTAPVPEDLCPFVDAEHRRRTMASGSCGEPTLAQGEQRARDLAAALAARPVVLGQQTGFVEDQVVVDGLEARVRRSAGTVLAVEERG